MKEPAEMTDEEKKAMIDRYIAAYNRFDIDAMVDLVHPDVVFQNIAGGKVDAEATGAVQFRELALQSKALFAFRHQKVTVCRFTADAVAVDIVFEGVLAADLPNGIKAGEKFKLEGQSYFGFKDNRIFRITDVS